jgi:hypothetical protein
MKVFGKVLIGTVAALGIVACLAATMVAAKVYRHLSARDRRDHYSTDHQGPGTARAFGFSVDGEEPPGIARIAGFGETEDDDDVAEARTAVIDEELCDASPEEQEVWKAELKGRSPEAVREILSVRKTMIAAVPPPTAGGVELTAADAAPPEPQRLSEPSGCPPYGVSAQSVAAISAAIEATTAAEQVILSNMTGELAELRRLREQLKTLRQLHAELSGASRAP